MGLLSNHPQQRSRIVPPFIQWDGTFNVEQLKALRLQLASLPLDAATVVGGGVNEKRKSPVGWLKREPATEWIFDHMNISIALLNDACFGFDLNGYETLQYTTYRAEDGGKYDAHMDLILGMPSADHEPRKLSITMLLSEPDEFEGGAFELFTGLDDDDRIIPEMKQGRIIAFPSFMLHRVTPVTKGVRQSLVTWVVGPKFR